MVSKVAVIALVAIVACPILLGYAMNLTEVTEMSYKESNEQATNMTPMLYNGTTGSAYTYAHGDIYRNNSSFHSFGTGGSYDKYPYFEKTTSQKTTMPLYKSDITNKTYNNETVFTSSSLYTDFYLEFTSSGIGASFYADIGGTETYIGYVAGLHSVYIKHTSSYDRYELTYYLSATTVGATAQAYNVTKIILIGGPTDGYLEYISAGTNNSFVDISAGYHFAETLANGVTWPNIDLANVSQQFTLTMNLDTITDANYTMHLDVAPYKITHNTSNHTSIQLQKTTVGSVVKWTLTNELDTSEPATELYLDPSLSDNTYQFTISADQIYDESTSKYYIVIHVKASYVGSWPILIGVANSYLDYNLDYVIRDNPSFIYSAPLSETDLSYSAIVFVADGAARTPVMRVDDSLFKSFEYQTITDRIYDPSAFRPNPTTTISNIQLYGTSITFGGQVFTVSKGGNISIGGHDIPLNDVAFNSVPDGNGSYYNRIGETVISTTAEPSTITFNGSWNASVATKSMESYSYTKTEWTPGQFAWDGIDQNFLMVGLLTSLGVFIALGIYIRRTKAALWPLLIVCGGAAMLFFCML